MYLNYIKRFKMTHKDSGKILEAIDQLAESVDSATSKQKDTIRKHFQEAEQKVDILYALLDNEEKYYLNNIAVLKRTLDSARKSKDEVQVKKVRTLLSGMETAYTRVKTQSQKIKRVIKP